MYTFIYRNLSIYIYIYILEQTLSIDIYIYIDTANDIHIYIYIQILPMIFIFIQDIYIYIYYTPRLISNIDPVLDGPRSSARAGAGGGVRLLVLQDTWLRYSNLCVYRSSVYIYIYMWIDIIYPYIYMYIHMQIYIYIYICKSTQIYCVYIFMNGIWDIPNGKLPTAPKRPTK